MAVDKNAVVLFVKVVESGSFSKAATREGVPVSTVSRKVAALERDLGVRLLERSTRQLRLTQIGQDYFESCQRGVMEFEAAAALVTDRYKEISGRLRISIPPSMSDIVILPLITAFQELYPNVAVSCLVTERYVDHIADGVDLSLRVGEPKDSSLIATTVSTHRPRLISTPHYLNSIVNIIHPNDVLAHVVVAFSRWGKPVQWTLLCNHESISIQPEPRLVINDYAGVVKGILDGFGISEVPSFICQPGLTDGRLIEVLPNWAFSATKVSAIFPSRYLSPLVRSFRDFCIQYFEKNPLS